MKKRILIPLLAVLVLSTAAVTYKSDFFEIAKQIEIFTDAYKQINMSYVDEVNPAELMDVAINSMFAHLDPYTNYWNAQQIQEARLKRSGNYTGIGANIQGMGDKILIKEVFKNLPADKAGLKAGDELIQIGETRIADFQDDAGELLNGAPGTTVELTFKRQGKTQTTTLKRASFTQKLVPFYKLFNDDIGYIKLTEFGATTSLEIGNALKDLKAQGAEKLILDLRGNPGGLLSEAVNTSNLFLPKDQLIVYTQSIVEKFNQTFVTKNEPLDAEIPIVVLIDGRSASASEIVSGSLQDLDRGVVIGAQSFGKGLVQRVGKLKYGTQMKYTISRYYTPSGRCIQAIDYAHRDKDGNPIKAGEGGAKEFKTKNGRKVYDAGGVMPDVKLESSQISGITRALIDENIIFDYATLYFYSHDLKEPNSFKFTNSDFTDFKNFVKNSDFQYKTQSEKEFEKAFELAKKDGLENVLKSEYQSLIAKLEQEKSRELDGNKAQIEQQLTDEILKRYFYQDGFYEYALSHNPEIQMAVEVLNDSKRYKNILRGK